MPATDAAAYSSSKAVLPSLGKSVSLEYAAQGVRVITVSPGPTATPMGRDEDVARQVGELTGQSSEDVANEAAASIPIKRFLRLEEIADSICFLAAVRASGITGTEVVVDGGLTPTI
jgi:NAD(P)-dependent dehydrogenase (short-subunit alcohol dehydrogenase family)